MPSRCVLASLAGASAIIPVSPATLGCCYPLPPHTITLKLSCHLDIRRLWCCAFCEHVGEHHCLVRLTLPAICTTHGSSVVYQSLRLPNRLASARQVSISGSEITVVRVMRICLRSAKY